MLPGEHLDTLGGKGGEKFLSPASLLIVDQGAGAVEELRKEFLGGRMAGRFLLLHDAGDPDLKEFIQVGAYDGEEADALEQGDAFVFGEFEDPSVETKPAEFAIEHGRVC